MVRRRRGAEGAINPQGAAVQKLNDGGAGWKNLAAEKGGGTGAAGMEDIRHPVHARPADLRLPVERAVDARQDHQRFARQAAGVFSAHHQRQPKTGVDPGLTEGRARGHEARELEF